LLDYADLTDLLAQYQGVAAIFDDVPQDADFPYVVIGEDTGLPWDDDVDTGIEGTLMIHSWGRAAGRREIKLIQNEIYNALHRNSFFTDSGRAIECVCEMADSFMDPDGITRHGVQRFRMIMQFND